jgi:hemerythrin-like domain-containing protein
MTDIVEHLTQDHQHIAKVLTALEKQVEIIEAGDTPDVDLMVEIMDYIRNYVIIFHHPAEELVFTRIVEYDETARPLVEELFHEHEEEREKSAVLSKVIDKVFLVDSMQPRNSLTALVRDYIEFNRRHQNKEDTTALPMANRLLSNKDWKTIAKELPDEKLPVLEEILEQEYRALYDHIRGSESS